MLKQKTNVETETELPGNAAIISVGNDNSAFTSLAASLSEIRKLSGIIGYILQDNTSAIIDLPEQDKISKYAILSSQILESSSEMARQFNLINIKSVMVEGKTVKMLIMNISENRISVFMEKTATFDSLMKRIQQ